MAIVLCILAATVVLMASGKFRSDLVAIGALLALMLTGILTPQEAFTGFSNAVIFVMAGMFIISGAIVRTGLASIISKKILGVAGTNTHVLFMLVMALAAVIGSLVSNTGTVAIMMPIVVSMSVSIHESPGRFLMPLAFMSSIGGMFTLIGNSPNMIVNSAYVEAGHPSMTLFSFFPVGVVCFLFGMLILAPVTSVYLSRRKNSKTEPKANSFSMRKLYDKYQLSEKMYRLHVPHDCELSGKCLDELHLPEKYGVVVAEISRPETQQGPFAFHPRTHNFSPAADTVLRPGDSLHVIGSISAVKSMAGDVNLKMAAEDAASARKSPYSSVGICELVIMSASRLIKRSVAESGLRHHFGINVLGIQRGDQYILDNIKDQIIQAGDALLVQGSWENLARLDEYSPNWVVVGRPNEQAKSGRLREKIPLVVAVILAMLAAMAFNLIPTVTAVLLAAVVLVVGGCFKNMDEAYKTMNWETLVMLACLLPMALAMEKTGIIDIVSGRMVALCRDHGPYLALAVVYAIASAGNVVISTTPVALFVTPIAMRIASTLGYNPLPFLFAVATASSMCFASPFSTPSNALVMSAGRYTFFDYVKVGLPLQIVMGVVMVLVLPLLFPFTAA